MRSFYVQCAKNAQKVNIFTAEPCEAPTESTGVVMCGSDRWAWSPAEMVISDQRVLADM